MADTKFVLTAEGQVFMDRLFPRPLHVDTFLNVVGHFGRVGNAGGDWFSPDEKLKEGFYWSEFCEDDEDHILDKGGFTQEEALEETRKVAERYLYMSQNHPVIGTPPRENPSLSILIDLASTYQFYCANPGVRSVNVKDIEAWARGKVPVVLPSEPCFETVVVPNLFDAAAADAEGQG